MHRVFVTGATGFVGRALVPALRGAGHGVRCLVRRGSEGHLRGLEAIERVEGDVSSPRGLEEGMAGCDTVIHLVGIIREHPAQNVTFDRVHVQGTTNVVRAAAAAGVRRYLHMSALGTRPGARSRYHQTKLAAEDVVRSSGLLWTIFRPSIIYGRGDDFITMLASMMRRVPIVPVIGDGRARLQPVRVEQVAEGFARAIEVDRAVKQVYEVGGPDTVTMPELIDLVAKAMGRGTVRKPRIPIGLVRVATTLLGRFPGFPLTSDQLLMLEEDNVCDPEPFFSTFGLTPVPLAEGLRRMLSR